MGALRWRILRLRSGQGMRIGRGLRRVHYGNETLRLRCAALRVTCRFGEGEGDRPVAPTSEVRVAGRIARGLKVDSWLRRKQEQGVVLLGG